MSGHPFVSRAGVVVPALAFLLLASLASAQNGRVSGTVKDANGKPMRAVTVIGHNPDAAPAVRTSVTDDKGRYVMIGLRSGVWLFTTSATGYLPKTTALRVSGIGPNTRLDFALGLDPEYRPPAMEGVKVAELQAQIGAADALLRGAKYVEAVAAYEALLARLPALTSLHLQIARAHRGAGDRAAAATSFSRALDGGIAPHVVLPELALMRLDEGDVEGARASLAKLEGQEATLGAALYARAVLAVREGDRAAARAHLEQFLAQEPDAPESPAARKLLEELTRQPDFFRFSASSISRSMFG